MHPFSELMHGAVLSPHSIFGVSSVRVTSWSMNWPQVIVTWVKFGRIPNSSPLKPWNILLLTRLVFGRGWPVTDSLRGCSSAAYSLGRTRRSGVKAAPWFMRHRLLHVPSIVRYLCWKHRSRSLRASQPSVSLNASNVCSADIAEDAAWRNSKVAIIRIIPKRNLKTKYSIGVYRNESRLYYGIKMVQTFLGHSASQRNMSGIGKNYEKNQNTVIQKRCGYVASNRRQGFQNTLMNGSPIFSVNFTNRKNPAKPNYYMSIKKSQAILNCFISEQK